MGEATAFSSTPEEEHDALPYTSMPYAYSQPAHLAAVVALFGLEAPALEGARVLELGCASGGNIIPLAVRFPKTHFIGIDIAGRDVDNGRKRIAALGLANIQIRQADLARPSLGNERFDYVICHGVFSWVPTDIQDAIFRICTQSLAENGVAVVSYNVLPGWHMRKIVRDICLHHVGKGAPPHQRAASARRLLADIASVSGTEPYGHLLRVEAARAVHRPASYILGEFLAEENTPCYFKDFVERAGRYGLSYVCEGDLNSSIPQIRDPKLRRQNRMLAGPDPLALEQYIDFLTGRTFRRSILVKADRIFSVQRSRKFARMRNLHIASELHLDRAQSDEKMATFKQPDGRAVKATNPSVRRALARLADAYPGTITWTQLTEGSGQERDRVERAIFEMVVAGQATVSISPLCVERTIAERPRVSLLARTEAADGQPWVTSLRHTPVLLPPLAAILLPYLDATNDRETLTLVAVKALMHGDVRIPDQSESEPGEKTNLQSIAAQLVERTLGYLARHAVLEPPAA